MLSNSSSVSKLRMHKIYRVRQISILGFVPQLNASSSDFNSCFRVHSLCSQPRGTGTASNHGIAPRTRAMKQASPTRQ